MLRTGIYVLIGSYSLLFMMTMIYLSSIFMAFVFWLLNAINIVMAMLVVQGMLRIQYQNFQQLTVIPVLILMNMLAFFLANDLWLKSRILDKEIFMSYERRLAYVRNKSCSYMASFFFIIAIFSLTELAQPFLSIRTLGAMTFSLCIISMLNLFAITIPAILVQEYYICCYTKRKKSLT